MAELTVAQRLEVLEVRVDDAEKGRERLHRRIENRAARLEDLFARLEKIERNATSEASLAGQLHKRLERLEGVVAGGRAMERAFPDHDAGDRVALEQMVQAHEGRIEALEKLAPAHLVIPARLLDRLERLEGAFGMVHAHERRLEELDRVAEAPLSPLVEALHRKLDGLEKGTAAMLEGVREHGAAGATERLGTQLETLRRELHEHREHFERVRAGHVAELEKLEGSKVSVRDHRTQVERIDGNMQDLARQSVKGYELLEATRNEMRDVRRRTDRRVELHLQLDALAERVAKLEEPVPVPEGSAGFELVDGTGKADRADGAIRKLREAIDVYLGLVPLEEHLAGDREGEADPVDELAQALRAIGRPWWWLLSEALERAGEREDEPEDAGA